MSPVAGSILPVIQERDMRLHSFLTVAVLILGSSCRANAEAVDRQIPSPALDPPAAGRQVAVLAGGCFWGMQGVVEHVQGVTKGGAGQSGGGAGAAHYAS